jgi:cation diffusion facilitator family transporter
MSSRAPAAAIYREVTAAALLGLAINSALGVVKLTGGLLSGSIALVSDAVNSLGDVFTSLIIVIALRVAQRPPDAEHPYGHSRAEAIAASNVALLIGLSALAVGWEAIQGLRETTAIPAVWTLWIAGANVLIKETLYRYKVRVARRTGSGAIMANAWDHRSDALSSLAVLIGLAAVRWEPEHLRWADAGAALIVVAVIVWSAVKLFRSSASELMDVQAPPLLVADVRRAAASVPRVKGVETLWVRKSGLEYFADIHVEVDPHLTVAEGHAIGHLVKDCLLERFTVLRDVLVHLEPFSGPAAARPPQETAPKLS